MSFQERYNQKFDAYERKRVGVDTFKFVYRELPKPEEIQQFLAHLDETISIAQEGVQEFPEDGFFRTVFVDRVMIKALFILSISEKNQWPGKTLPEEVRQRAISEVQQSINLLQEYESGDLRIETLNGYKQSLESREDRIPR